MTEQAPSEMARILATDPLWVRRLLVAHAPDASGHCRTCTLGGQQGRQVWPCSLHGIAAEAERLRGR